MIIPQNYSVPYCSKKVYKENGAKISFHEFLEDESVSSNGLLQYEEISGQIF